MFAAAVAILLTIAALIQFVYIAYFFAPPEEHVARDEAWLERTSFHPDAPGMQRQPPVSVLVCAHNEARNLARNLPLLLGLDHQQADGSPNYEVIVVNDRSEDDSAAVLEGLLPSHPHLRVVTIGVAEPRTFPGKKDALSRGLAAAANEIILMTDADCRPANQGWIRWMAAPFNRGEDIVAGFGGYEPAPGLLNKFIRSETLHTFAQFRGYCRKRRPYMAVGRNLACRRSILLQAEADPLWRETASGDDDLLVRLCATGDNMIVIDAPESHTYSEAKKTFGEYLHQKQRHVSTGKLYKPGVKRLLAGYALSHALLWWTIPAALACVVQRAYTRDELFTWAHLLYVIPVLRFCIFYHYLEKSAGGRPAHLRFFWPVFDFGWMVYNFVLSPYILWKTRNRWR